MSMLTATSLLIAAVGLQPAPPETGIPQPPNGGDVFITSVPAPPPADILEVIPANASFVAAVRDLAGFDTNVAGLLERLDIQASPYTILKSWLQIVTGLDDRGSAALVFLPNRSPSAAHPDMVLLLPMVDRAAMLAFLDPMPLGDGDTRVTLRGRETYVAVKDRHAVFGPDARVVRSLAESRQSIGGRWSAQEVERYRANDWSLWLDPTRMSCGFGDTAGFSGSLIALADSALRELRFNAIGLSGRADASGITLELLMQRGSAPPELPQTEVAKPLLAGLPVGPVVLAVGAAGNGEREPFLTGMRALLSYLTGSGICTAGGVDRFVEAAASAHELVQSAALSVSRDSAGEPGPFTLAMVIRVRGEGAVLVNRIERVVDAVKGGLVSDPAYHAALQRVQFRRAAETVKDVSVDYLTADLSGYGGTEAAAFRESFGVDQFLVRVGVVAPSHVVITFGGGSERFENVVEAVRAEQAPLASTLGIVSPSEGTAPARWLEGYLAVDRFIGLVRSLRVDAERPPAVLDAPESTAPITVVAYGAGPSTSRFDVHLPVAALAEIRAAWTDPTTPARPMLSRSGGGDAESRSSP